MGIWSHEIIISGAEQYYYLLYHPLMLHCGEVLASKRQYLFQITYSISYILFFTPMKLELLPHFLHFLASGVTKTLFKGLNSLVILPYSLILHCGEIWMSKKRYLFHITQFSVFHPIKLEFFPHFQTFFGIWSYKTPT